VATGNRTVRRQGNRDTVKELFSRMVGRSVPRRKKKRSTERKKRLARAALKGTIYRENTKEGGG